MCCLFRFAKIDANTAKNEQNVPKLLTKFATFWAKWQHVLKHFAKALTALAVLVWRPQNVQIADTFKKFRTGLRDLLRSWAWLSRAPSLWVLMVAWCSVLLLGPSGSCGSFPCAVHHRIGNVFIEISLFITNVCQLQMHLHKRIGRVVVLPNK